MNLSAPFFILNFLGGGRWGCYKERRGGGEGECFKNQTF